MPSQQPAVQPSAKMFQSRRSRLRALLMNTSALFAAGMPRLRNIPAIAYPYRPSSHCLYFAGMLPQRSLLLVHPDHAIIFVPEVTLDDQVWNGPPETEASICARTGVDRVLPLTDLPTHLESIGQTNCLALPSVDPATNSQLSELLGRTPDLNGPDRELALAVVDLRIVHDAFAKSEMRSAAAVTASAFARALARTRPGLFEYQIKAELLAAAHEAGMQEAFASGCSVRGEVIHNESFAGELKSGDLLLIDFGAEAPSGYSSDVTRVWPVSAAFSPEQREIYQLVLQVQQTAISAVEPGMRFRELHLLACRTMAEGLVSLGLLRGAPEDLVARGAHALFFPHGLGHLLGLDTHDLGDVGDLAGYPISRKRSTEFGTKFLRLDRDLAADMVLTIEPGWYWIPALLENKDLLERFSDCLGTDRVNAFRSVRGVRIEDDILVTPDGAEVLTAAIPKQLAEIEALRQPH